MKLGVRSKLFLISLGLVLASMLAGDTFLAERLDKDLTDRVRSDLFVRAALVEHDVSALRAGLDDMGPWDALADQLAKRAGGRVTIIRKDGFVLGDSELDGDSLRNVENHAGRPEVVEALATGFGSSTRFSSTIRRRLMYVAVRFRRGNDIAGVARLALPLTEVDNAVTKVRQQVLLATAFGVLLAIAISIVAAHWMSTRVRNLTDVAQRLSGGDLSARTRVRGDDELAELGRVLGELASNLSKALDELRSDRDLLGRVLDGMREGVLLVDRDGRVSWTNPALREMLLLGTDISGKLPLEVIRSAELKRIFDGVAVTGRAEVAEVDLGELKPRRLLVHATPLAGDGGILTVFVDVTDLRRLESMRKDFVANVSHELRTPIATIRSASETLRRAGTADETALEFIGIIDRNVERLQRLVEDLLDLSRIESRQFRLTLEAVDVAPVIQHVVSLFRGRADARGIRLMTDLGALEPVRGDRRALEQVLSNLIENAVKYSTEGCDVVVHAALTGERVMLSVADTGPGIATKHLPRIFERFYRVDAGRSRDVGGTGLGLSIVKHLVEAMGGSVTVESAPGAGSIFTVMLPAAADSASCRIAGE